MFLVSKIKKQKLKVASKVYRTFTVQKLHIMSSLESKHPTANVASKKVKSNSKMLKKKVQSFNYANTLSSTDYPHYLS